MTDLEFLAGCDKVRAMLACINGSIQEEITPGQTLGEVAPQFFYCDLDDYCEFVLMPLSMEFENDSYALGLIAQKPDWIVGELIAKYIKLRQSQDALAQSRPSSSFSPKVFLLTMPIVIGAVAAITCFQAWANDESWDWRL